MKLTDREWKYFNPMCFVDEVIVKNKMSKAGLSDRNRTPVYSSQVDNGGIMGFTSECADHKIESDFYVLFGDHTREFHVVDSDFCVSDNVKVLKPKTNNKYAYMFIAICWKKAIPDLGYARHWRAARRVSVLIPVTDAGEPDYDFMEQYVREILLKNKDKYLSFAKKRIAEIGEWKGAGSLTDREWKAFQIGMLFDRIDRGKISSTQGLVHTEKGIPYVGATANNNGVLYCVECDDPKLIQDGNCVAFIRDGQGSVGLSMYRATPCVATVNVSLAYASWVNRYTGIFVSRSSNMIRTKYSFGYKRKDERLKRDFIMLPVTDAGEPDFDFMEQYTKDLMLKKYLQYDAFSEREKSAISETAV